MGFFFGLVKFKLSAFHDVKHVEIVLYEQTWLIDLYLMIWNILKKQKQERWKELATFFSWRFKLHYNYNLQCKLSAEKQSNVLTQTVV